MPGEPSPFFGSSEHCRYCEYDAVCPVDRDAQYESKVDAPELAAYHDLDLPAEDDE